MKPHAPYRDEEMGAICRWLIAQRMTMHVTLNGSVTLRPWPADRKQKGAQP